MINTTANLSRRNILMGIAAASTAATATHSAPTEVPALVELADALPALAKAHTDACESVEWILAEWQPQVPDPDLDLIRYSESSRRYTKIDGHGIEVAPYPNADIKVFPSIGTAETFQNSAERSFAEAERKARTPSKRGAKHMFDWAEKERALIEPARDYWAEFDRIVEASGIEGAKDRVSETRDALHAAVSAIMATEERSMAGVVIKAEALHAWSCVEYFHKALNPDACKWSDQMAAAIMRQASIS